MAKSLGGALKEGRPVVFTREGHPPEVVCEPGKEREALELMEKMKLIVLMRPADGRASNDVLRVYAEKMR